jgi:hypothetical protein
MPIDSHLPQADPFSLVSMYTVQTGGGANSATFCVLMNLKRQVREARPKPTSSPYLDVLCHVDYIYRISPKLLNDIFPFLITSVFPNFPPTTDTYQLGRNRKLPPTDKTNEQHQHSTTETNNRQVTKNIIKNTADQVEGENISPGHFKVLFWTEEQ